MNQFKVIILLIATSMLLCACPSESGQNFIYIVNKSDKTITFDFSINKQDTTFYCSNTGRTILFSVESNSTFELDDGDSYSGWDTDLETLTIFILDGELYNKYWQQPCDTIRKYVPILYTYKLTRADLQQMKWTVVYPPEK